MKNGNVKDASEMEQWNALLGSVLATIQQHFLHARILRYQGHMESADYEYKLYIESMRHADLLIEHMLALNNAFNLQSAVNITVEATLPAIMRASRDQALGTQRLIHLLMQIEDSVNKLSLLAALEKSLKERLQYLAEWFKKSCIQATAPDDNSTVVVRQKCA